MPAEVQPGPHGVLVSAKQRQPVLNEISQRQQGLLAGHRPVEAAQLTRVVGKALCHQLQHLARDLVLRKEQRFGQVLRAGLAKSFAVVGVKVPLPAQGLVAVHQHLVLLAHLAVEKLHAQTGRLAGPLAKRRQTA